MDMWPAYINSAEELLFNAAITHDRFHLIIHPNMVIDQVRQREVKHYYDLKNIRFTLLKNSESFTEKQRINYQVIFDANYEVSKAWQVRENPNELSTCKNIFA
jgi:transposase